MKILWLTEFFPTRKESIIGGVQARCFYVERYLNKNNKISVVNGVPSRWAKPSLISLLLRIIYLFKQIYQGLSFDFDIIEASNFVTYLPAIIISKIKNKPLVFWYPDVFLGNWVKNVGPVGLIGEVIERLILFLGADYYIAISESVKNKLLVCGVPEYKISVVYCGIDFDEVKGVRHRKQKDKYDICAISRLVPYKRISDLIEVVAILKTKYQNIKVVILGSGSQKKELVTLRDNLNLQQNVKIIDRFNKHEEVMELVSSSKIFCHPSVVEGFGIVIIEAMSLGKPVVASDIPVVREITFHGRGALLFKPMKIRLLAEKIDKLLSDRDLYSQKSKEAKLVAEKYDWKSIAKQTEKIYLKLKEYEKD